MPTIMFTGGGSAGHVTPNLAVIKKFQAENWQIVYVGSAQGIEKEIISKTNLPYYAIASGKLRRYFSWQNFLDPFKILFGIMQAFFICRRLKPQVVFSKGGFVAFPVVVGAWLNRIPVFIHESDLTPGFANRLSFPLATRVLLTFAETKKYFSDQCKLVISGTPIRANLLQGDAERGRQLCHFKTSKPILLIIGGGLGADNVNQAIRHALPKLLPHYQIIHLCGKNKTDAKFNQLPGYQQFDYVTDELADLFACADLIITRAGANSIY
jgi:UDP-N-acetylglucosamine--N-acetylmuramyl-(pentapeptide) pyrophosphoryl-undecaprenol N-acetylglucosamine transferase